MTNEQDDALSQSGVLPYRRRDHELEVLLITSLDTGRWVPPKGNIDSGLTARQSAGKEAFEEAGIRGALSEDSIGSYVYRKSDPKGGSLCRVEIYAMKVTALESEWPESAMRRRQWMSPERAASSVAEPDLRELILAFARNGERD